MRIAIQHTLTFVTTCTALLALACAAAAPTATTSPQRMFSTPEAAVQTLIDVVKKGSLKELLPLFGPDGEELASSSDPATGRQNREVFAAAAAEGWHLEQLGPDKRALVVGNESWTFPIPIVRDGQEWRFDTAAGKEEVIARRIGRNELAVIEVCRTYVVAQQLYARDGHDGRRAGLYARTFRSDPGKQNGLYWPAVHGQKRSPLGDLLAEAAADGRAEGSEPSPFHGYYFRILEGQGANARGGATDYVVNGEMSRGFALVAWPAEYDVTGVMTFIVNQDGIVHESDLGAGTSRTASALTRYDPEASWQVVR
jgi:hypothetical protein